MKALPVLPSNKLSPVQPLKLSPTPPFYSYSNPSVQFDEVGMLLINCSTIWRPRVGRSDVLPRYAASHPLPCA